MKPIDTNDPLAQSADLLAQNIEQLKALFPEAFTEGQIDFDVLKQLLGGLVDEKEEKYGLNWHGKRQARQLALTPSIGTLRPCPEESVDWETTQNLMIEGENLEVLKLLQKSYAGKVKMIYIDPPYNTGKDFVYPDNFKDSIQNYLELTGQVDVEGKKLSTNTETSGRFHTDWLNMMYPRLKLARNLLREDGVIFISIDDNEVSNQRKICEDVFGEENFVASIIWKKRSGPPNDRIIGTVHEYVLCYAKSAESDYAYLSERSDVLNATYTNPDNDLRGDWKAGDLSAGNKGGRATESCIYPIINPVNGKSHMPPDGRRWVYNREKMAQLLQDNRVWFGSDGSGKPKYKRFLTDVRDGITTPTLFIDTGTSMSAAGELNTLMPQKDIFQTPKPTSLLCKLIEISSTGQDIIIDFFAGSGTTGHATMLQNAGDGSSRRYILVEIPQPIDSEDKDQKTSAIFCDKLGKPRNIAELTKERLRRAGLKVSAENPLFAGDTGFRVFKLDSSNIRTWDPDRNQLPASLEEYADHIKPDRSQQDILFEILLKLGLDLTVPIDQKTVGTHTVHSIGGGVLLACLSEKITLADIEPLAMGIVEWHKQLAPVGETQLVFRDSAFADDVSKTNLVAILSQNGLSNIRSL